jgi:hypothetical protein
MPSSCDRVRKLTMFPDSRFSACELQKASKGPQVTDQRLGSELFLEVPQRKWLRSLSFDNASDQAVLSDYLW